jgi:hypothetical protein
MISRRKESTRRKSENRVNIGRAFACPSRILDIYMGFLSYMLIPRHIFVLSRIPPPIFIYSSKV